MENATDSGVQNQAALKHSGLGIASFIIAVISTAIIFISFGILAYGEKIYPEIPIPTDVIQPVVVMILFFGSFLSFIGFGLGMAGLIIKGRKKSFSILGFTINSALLIGTILILIIGVLANIGII